MNPLAQWFDWLSKRRRHRRAARKERERSAIIRIRERRKAAHREWKSLDGELKRVTCEAIAAEVGREWGS